MDKALDETERIMRSIPELAERMSRSTRAVEPDQAWDQAAAIFGTYKPKVGRYVALIAEYCKSDF